MDKAAIGIVGLGVMGHSLALNMERNGNSVAGYNQDESVARAFRDGAAKGKRITVAESNAAMAELLERPRCILMMVPAGDPVDVVASGGGGSGFRQNGPTGCQGYRDAPGCGR